MLCVGNSGAYLDLTVFETSEEMEALEVNAHLLKGYTVCDGGQSARSELW